jgi:serine/threonine protein kinase
MDALIGKTLGKYQIIEQLGEGGMATVYKAFDPSLERFVAIKVIRMANQVDPLFLGRFQREAKALAKLDHPYILKVLDYGEENGVPYLVMPFVAHGTLKQYTQARLPYDQAIAIILPIADALSYAHKRKIIHRDIKPANILFGESGEPLLSDFGIAKMLDAGEQTQLTSTGFGIGTPAYMAPEQWNGAADERTDIYALGVVLYELITSRCPYQAETPAAILIKQSQDPLPRPKSFAPDLPDNVEAIIFKALAKDPALRFQTMQEFIYAMNTVLQNKTTSFIVPPIISSGGEATQIAYSPTMVKRAPNIAAPISPSIPPPVAERKRTWLPFLIGGIGLLTIGLIIVLVFSLPKLNSRGQKSGETSAGLSQGQATQNGQLNPTNSFNKTETPVKATSTGEIQFTETPQSITTINKLPADIPVFTPNNGDATTTDTQGQLMFSYSTTEDTKIVSDFYLTQMKALNWEVKSTTEMTAQNMVMYLFSKDTRNVMIYVIADQNKHTFIEIMIENGSN